MVNTRFKLAECKTNAVVARSFLDTCISAHLKGELTVEEAAAAKYWHSEMAWMACDAAMQLHGGAGYMNEYNIARVWRDQRIRRIYGGTSEIMRELIGRSL